MKYSRERLQAQSRFNITMSENHGTNEDINSFKGYFTNYTLEYGKHGPEFSNDGKNIYLSVYHFLQYEGKDPSQYKTKECGGALSALSTDVIPCKYKEFDYDFNKYQYQFLIEKMDLIETFKR